LDDYKKVLLELIKQSQFGDGKSFPVENCDWDMVYSEAINQSVIGLIAPEVLADVRKTDEKWRKAQDRQFAYSIRYFYAENELTKLLDDAEIPFVILKGTSAAIYYNHPDRRSMGDIDFLVPQDKFETTLEFLAINGYIRESEPHNSRHVGFTKNGLSYECHHHFSHDDLDNEAYIIEGLNQREYAEIESDAIDSFRFPMLPRLSNGLVLLDHMRMHLQSGLGLRQIIDWMMYVNKELSDEYWNKEFSHVVREKGLERFAKVATKMCQKYLGLPDSITWCNDADEVLCDKLFDMLFESGNFGRKKGRGNSVETVRTQIKRFGLFRWLQRAGEYNWRAYKKRHWLKPLCWLYQIFRYAKQGIKSGRSYNQLSADLENGNNRYELLKDLGVVFET